MSVSPSPTLQWCSSIMITQTKQSLENFYLGQTYCLSDYYGAYLLSNGQFILSEIIAIIPGGFLASRRGV